MNNRDAWIEISVANIKYNIKQIQAKAGHSKLVGVIKANAYGHGAVNYAKALDEQGVDTFAVATIPEAIQLREAGFSSQQMIVLGIAPEESIADILKYDIISVVCELSFAEKLSEAAAKIGKTANCMIAIDTGMGRIGYTHCDESTLVEIKKICSLKCLEIFGLFSHFATADAEDKGYAEEQHKKYDDFYAEITKSGVAVKNRILANSAAIMEMPGTHYDYVRPGIILYGIYPSKEVDRRRLDLKPVMTVKAKVIYLKTVEAGVSIGYGRTYKAPSARRIATLPVGYADGLPRLCSNKGRVIVNGYYAPIVGNVCMDQCMIDVTDIPDVKLGDTVIVMGKEGKLSVTADDIGDQALTIPYEITCGFGQRLEKIVV